MVAFVGIGEAPVSSVSVVCALVLLAGSLAQAASPSCNPSTMDCSPVIACIEATGEIFRGSSFGVDFGPLHVETDAGVTCTGTWRRTISGIGVAVFSCSDGRSGTSVYTWFEPETGTAVGHGTFTDGAIVKFWAGNNLEKYFAEVNPDEVQKMSCQTDDMFLS